MNLSEFSSQFDILYDNVTSGKAPGLNDYEKSVFLTKAQDQIVKGYFTPKGNLRQEGFNDSLKRTVDFSKITKSYSVAGSVGNTTYKNTLLFDKPTDLFLPRGYILRSTSGTELQVKDVSEEELTRLFSKPYKEPYKGQAYKLDDSTTNDVYEIIVGSSQINKDFTLHVRYIKQLSPIILVNLKEFELEMGLPEGYLTIKEQFLAQECELEDIMHEPILDRAVSLAKIHYEGGPQEIVQFANLNE